MPSEALQLERLVETRKSAAQRPKPQGFSLTYPSHHFPVDLSDFFDDMVPALQDHAQSPRTPRLSRLCQEHRCQPRTRLMGRAGKAKSRVAPPKPCWRTGRRGRSDIRPQRAARVSRRISGSSRRDRMTRSYHGQPTREASSALGQATDKPRSSDRISLGHNPAGFRRDLPAAHRRRAFLLWPQSTFGRPLKRRLLRLSFDKVRATWPPGLSASDARPPGWQPAHREFPTKTRCERGYSQAAAVVGRTSTRPTIAAQAMTPSPMMMMPRTTVSIMSISWYARGGAATAPSRSGGAPRRARWTDPPRYSGGLPAARRIVRAPNGSRTGCAAERACCPRLSRKPSRSRISARWASTNARAANSCFTLGSVKPCAS